MYVFVLVMTVLLWLGVAIDTILAAICQHKANVANEDTLKCLNARLSKQGAQYLNGSFFAILFILMVLTVVPLCRAV